MLLPLATLLLATLVDDDESRMAARFVRAVARERPSTFGLPILVYADGSRVERLLTYDQVDAAMSDLEINSGVRVFPSDEDDFLDRFADTPLICLRKPSGKAAFLWDGTTKATTSEPRVFKYFLSEYSENDAARMLCDVLPRCFAGDGELASDFDGVRKGGGLDIINDLYSPTDVLFVSNEALPVIRSLRRLDQAIFARYRRWKVEDHDREAEKSKDAWAHFNAKIKDLDVDGSRYLSRFKKHVEASLDRMTQVSSLREAFWWASRLSHMTSTDLSRYEDDPDWKRFREEFYPDLELDLSPAEQARLRFDDEREFFGPIDMLNSASDDIEFLVGESEEELRIGPETRRGSSIVAGFSDTVFQLSQNSEDDGDVSLTLYDDDGSGIGVSHANLLCAFDDAGILSSLSEQKRLLRKDPNNRITFSLPVPESLIKNGLFQGSPALADPLFADLRTVLHAYEEQGLLLPREISVAARLDELYEP